MAPLSPISSQKRSTPSQSDDEIDQHASKKVRTGPSPMETPSPVTVPNIPIVTIETSVAHPKMFNDDPQQLLLRSIVMALQHVGFEAATAEALEAMRAQVETYAEHFLSRVTTSMTTARRPQPTPTDFQYALNEFQIPIASIEPHLRPPIPPSRSSVPLEKLPAEEPPTTISTQLLGTELDGETDKKSRSYIPKHFPSFPSKHTYKWTEKESARETDPRRIREEAAKAARQGEEALRRLTKVGKAGKEKDVKKSASRDPRRKERHEIWEKTMAGFRFADYEAAGTIMVVSKAENDNLGASVNAERSYFRKGPGRMR